MPFSNERISKSSGIPAKAGVAADNRLRLFISYSRKDIRLAEALVLALDNNNFQVTIDKRDMPYGEEFQRELADFIRAADTVVWLLSPNSIESKWCNWELGEVARLNKRLVILRVQDVAIDELPEMLGKIHILPGEGLFDVDRHLSELVVALETNRSWLKEATRLGERAHDWLIHDRDRNFLLRGLSLRNAELWSSQQGQSARRQLAISLS
ncbi:hypothetical protein ABID65_005382 [Bradyrhizobium sp. S3.9.2]|uniref:toll/interleukin-1 receptor domain-containing protein n=1 Tax=Bradyrhizobium sp. S3.9.2 TaxID=3156432 RepID=UPI003390D831